MKQSAHHGFTLVELLVVMSIVSLLSSVVTSSVNSARDKARATQSMQTIKQYLLAIDMMKYDNNGRLPNFGASTVQCFGRAVDGQCGGPAVSAFVMPTAGQFNAAIQPYYNGAPPANPTKTKSKYSPGNYMFVNPPNPLNVWNPNGTEYILSWTMPKPSDPCGIAGAIFNVNAFDPDEYECNLVITD